MAIRELDPRIKKLREEGNIVWSYSRLGAFHTCPYSYKLAYVIDKKIRGEDNIYSLLGSLAHDILEEAYNTKAYNGNESYLKFKVELDKIITDGYSFSKDEKKNIGIYNNYVNSMSHFFKTFTIEDFKSKQEGLVLHHLFDNNYIQGYYDQIRNYNGSLEVIDFKTSTEFKGKDRDEKARQLILYADILNKNSKHKIDKVAWYMLKYCKISYILKNGKIRSTIALRSEWVNKIEKQLEKDLISLGMDDLEIGIYLSEASRNNSLDEMPIQIIEKYKVEPYFDYYEYTQEHVDEVYEYIRNTIKAIEVETEWKANLESSYFCNELCGHSKICPYIQEKNKEFLPVDEDLEDLL